MLIVALGSLLLVALCTLVRYETLSALDTRLPRLGIPRRRKLLLIAWTASFAYLEMERYWKVGASR